RLHQRRREVTRQAFVAAHVFVRAHVLVASMPDENRAGDELERATAHAVTEAALAHVRNRERIVPFEERTIVRAGRAAVINDRDEIAPEQQSRWHLSRVYLSHRQHSCRST